MFRRALIAAWVLFLTGLLFLFVMHPRPGFWGPYWAIRPALALLVLTSCGYGVSRMYREGMKRGRRP